MRRLIDVYWRPGSPWFWLAVLGLVVYGTPALAVYLKGVWWATMPVTLGLAGAYLVFDGMSQLRIRAAARERAARVAEALTQMPDSVQHMGADQEGNQVFSITRRNGETSTFKMPAGFDPARADDVQRLIYELTPEAVRDELPDVLAFAEVRIKNVDSAPEDPDGD